MSTQTPPPPRTDEQEIVRLLHIYAECIDCGDAQTLGELFAHADVDFGPGSESVHGAEAMRGLFRSLIIIHPDGTPRTRHLISNAIVDFDENSLGAACRSYHTVLQQTEAIPLQVIAAGRYFDRFEKVDGRWRFARRTFSFDFAGNLTDHSIMES